jgi:hypothetical protein
MLRELRTRGRIGCASWTLMRATVAPSNARVFSTWTPAIGTLGSTLKLSAKPTATTSRISTTNVRGSGCEATYGTGSDASMESTPARSSTRDVIRFRTAISVLLARSGTMTPSASSAPSTGSFQ